MKELWRSWVQQSFNLYQILSANKSISCWAEVKAVTVPPELGTGETTPQTLGSILGPL